MRNLRKNKQKMYYSLYNAANEVYDETGSSVRYIYDKEIGTSIPVEIGTQQAEYYPPVEFSANITSNLNEMHIKSYGVDQSSIYAKIVAEKGQLPLKVGTIIWRESEIQWEDEQQRIPNQESADYTVVGLLTEYQHYDSFLLQRNTPEKVPSNDNGDNTNGD